MTLLSGIKWVLAGCLMLVATAAIAQAPSESLRRLFDDERSFYWREDPLAATADGMHAHDDRLPSVTPTAQARRLEGDRGFLKRLRAIDRASLSPQEQVSYDLFDFMVSQRVTLAGYRDWRAPLNSDSGFHADILFLHELANPRTTVDYERYIARLKDLPRYFDENVDNMRLGMREGFTLPAEILEGISKVIAGEQFTRVEDCPLYRPFADFPSTVPQSDREPLATAGRAAIGRWSSAGLCPIPTLLRGGVPPACPAHDCGDRIA